MIVPGEHVQSCPFQESGASQSLVMNTFLLLLEPGPPGQAEYRRSLVRASFAAPVVVLVAVQKIGHLVVDLELGRWPQVERWWDQRWKQARGQGRSRSPASVLAAGVETADCAEAGPVCSAGVAAGAEAGNVDIVPVRRPERPVQGHRAETGG